MFLLDTNVLSEIRKSTTSKIDRNVENWINRTDADVMFVSAVTIMELEIGILSLEQRDPLQGKAIRAWLMKRVLAVFDGRILPFDLGSAVICAKLNVPDRRSRNDSLIAATALQHGLIIVTRNVVDFAGTGVNIVNPWQA